MDVHHTVHAQVVPPPDAFQKLITTIDTSRFSGQGIKEVELEHRQF